ncbi:glycosyltransferase family 2 protein [Bradyrhizobium sp. AC87j1]|uniref:glycosyltransferase family 2 protein n=1 Tax=Bradyrhizobium sp. AC87j1 TaxID=2055894 RepID=UPI000CEBDF1E|nr:glycosyltransferase family 2 protein [Bradyrhizobium sp. AC87j1]PPQ16833.1 glycosyltransferase family 2 protein [Bradyrhizobium sp. AC87j1]
MNQAPVTALGSIDVVILTYNEEVHIARAIQTVSKLTRNIFVIDSYSSDQTVEIARSLGATVLQNKFVNQAKQFNWALDNAALSSNWIMRLDADEVLEPELIQEIQSKLPQLGPEVTGINLKRKHIFMGRWIKHGDRYPLVMLRIWRRGCARVEDRWMDEHVAVLHGKTVTLAGNFADWNLRSLSHFIDKHNGYATREAVELLNAKLKFLDTRSSLTSGNSSGQAALKRLIKDEIYNRIPFPLSSLGYFLYRYILRLGFLDGREGLIYHFLQGYWYRFLVGARAFELNSKIAGLSDAQEARRVLTKLTGLRIESDPQG